MSDHLPPRIAISLGDPGGIGPEVVAKALASDTIRAACRPVVIGDLATFRRATEVYGTGLRLSLVESPDDTVSSGNVPVIQPAGGSGEQFPVGKITAMNGRAAHSYITTAAALALAGRVDGICTAPISKEAMYAAGFQFPGHTELLAQLCGGCDVRMMLEGGGLHVVLQTIHVALRDVPGLLTTQRIHETIRISDAWATRYMCAKPRIAVCGLNPHAGEGGHFGTEEIEIIAPAIAESRSAGLDIYGPHPADTVFFAALEGKYDLVVAMYHDQALIPVKTLDFHRGVNVTLGLPIIRTSPDHGTAFDIAGKGIANSSSMESAILRAAALCQTARTSQ